MLHLLVFRLEDYDVMNVRGCTERGKSKTLNNEIQSVLGSHPTLRFWPVWLSLNPNLSFPGSQQQGPEIIQDIKINIMSECTMFAVYVWRKVAVQPAVSPCLRRKMWMTHKVFNPLTKQYNCTVGVWVWNSAGPGRQTAHTLPWHINRPLKWSQVKGYCLGADRLIMVRYSKLYCCIIFIVLPRYYRATESCLCSLDPRSIIVLAARFYVQKHATRSLETLSLWSLGLLQWVSGCVWPGTGKNNRIQYKNDWSEWPILEGSTGNDTENEHYE